MLPDVGHGDCDWLCHDLLSVEMRSSVVACSESPVRDLIHRLPSSENTGIPLHEFTVPSLHPAKWRVPSVGWAILCGVILFNLSLLSGVGMASCGVASGAGVGAMLVTSELLSPIASDLK